MTACIVICHVKLRMTSYMQILFSRNSHQMDEKGDIKVHVYIKKDLSDLLSGLIYKNLFYQEMCSIIGYTQTVQTTLKGKPFVQHQLENTHTHTKPSKTLLTGSCLNAFENIHICLVFVFILFAVFCFLFISLPQSSF